MLHPELTIPQGVLSLLIEDQANDRVYRIGQKKPVYIHDILSMHPDYKDEYSPPLS
jgi:hypothetical protein